MRIEFTLVATDGTRYQGAAELRQMGVTQGQKPLLIAHSESKGLPGHILALRDDSFFREPRTAAEVHTKLLESYHCMLNRVQMALLRLHRRRELRKTFKEIDEQEHPAYVW
jgi:hypothetical protein